MLREVPQRVVETDEDRELRQQRQARRRRVDVLLLVELHQLFVELLAVALVLALDLLHLRRIRLHVLHRMDLLDRQRHEQHPYEHGQSADRPRPRQAERVEAVEDVPKEVFERLQQVDEGHVNTFWSRAWSTPPRLHGLQRSSRQPASTVPLKSPNSLYASIAYCEQEGWYLQVPPPRSGLSVTRYAHTSATPTYLTTVAPIQASSVGCATPMPSRAPRRRVRRASRTRL